MSDRLRQITLGVPAVVAGLGFLILAARRKGTRRQYWILLMLAGLTGFFGGWLSSDVAMGIPMAMAAVGAASVLSAVWGWRIAGAEGSAEEIRQGATRPTETTPGSDRGDEVPLPTTGSLIAVGLFALLALVFAISAPLGASPSRTPFLWEVVAVSFFGGLLVALALMALTRGAPARRSSLATYRLVSFILGITALTVARATMPRDVINASMGLVVAVFAVAAVRLMQLRKRAARDNLTGSLIRGAHPQEDS